MSNLPDPSDKSEDARLLALGYRPEFKRVLGLFADFSLGYSYMSPMAGVFALFSTALVAAGPPFFWTMLAVLAGHLDPPLEALWPMITTDARRALGLAPGHIDGSRTRDLIILDAPSTTEALSGAALARPLTSCLEGHSE